MFNDKNCETWTKNSIGNQWLTNTLSLGNNPMVGMTVAVAVAIEEAAKAGKF